MGVTDLPACLVLEGTAQTFSCGCHEKSEPG